MNADGSNPQRLTDGEGENTKPAWAPDGSSIAFVSTRSGNPEIYRMDVNGESLARITQNEEEDTDPVWGEEGDYLLFASNRDVGYEIYLQTLAGSSAKRKTYTNVDSIQPDWASSEFLLRAEEALSSAEEEEPLAKRRSRPLADGDIQLTVSDSQAGPGQTAEVSLNVTGRGSTGRRRAGIGV